MDKFYKKNYIQNTISYENDLEFQIIEWHCQDEVKDNFEDEDDENQFEKSKYTIRCFGELKKVFQLLVRLMDLLHFII